MICMTVLAKKQQGQFLSWSSCEDAVYWLSTRHVKSFQCRHCNIFFITWQTNELNWLQICQIELQESSGLLLQIYGAQTHFCRVQRHVGRRYFEAEKSFLQSSSCPLLLDPLASLHFDRQMPMRFPRSPPSHFNIHSFWQESHADKFGIIGGWRAKRVELLLTKR